MIHMNAKVVGIGTTLLVVLIFGAVAAFDWLGGVKVFADVSLTQLMAGLATIAGVVTRWCEQQIPARKELDPKKPGGKL